MSGSTSNFTLQLLHASDLEAANTALSRMAQFAAVVDKLDDQYANTLKLIAGDAWIPGPFYAAEGDASITPALRTALTAAGVPGAATASAASTRVSVAFTDVIGTNVAVFGNHEFDGGTGPINDALGVANYPYLSANYDFSTDPNLRTRVTADGQEASSIKGRIAGSTVVTIGGERIGVVGATTQLLQQISSPGAVTSKAGTVDDVAALARVLQPVIDALTAQGINKIVLASHLQQYQLEQALAPLLRGVDIIVSAGSHAVFADSTDTLRPGDVAAQGYPVVLRGADGNPTLEVNTQNEYSYVGRLVATFDSNGVIIPGSVDPAVSGAYVTTDAGVAALYGNADPYAAGSYGATVKALIAPVSTVIATKDGNIQGFSSVFLDGNRVTVRQQESNLGDLTADANLFVARQLDPTTTVSIKNGGGIRDIIGSFTTDAASRPIPTVANPSANKPDQAVSQLDIENSLRFNNNLSLVTITAQQLVQVMEFGATLIQPGQTPGGFVQVGGLRVSYDTTRTAQVLDTLGRPTTVGQRVRNLAITNDDGSIRDVLVADGVVVGNGARPIRVVTLDFIATSTAGAGTLGGDGNPIASYATNRVNLLGNPALGAGLSTFAAPGTEQDATAEYLKARFPTAATAFATAETGQSGDQRIQVLQARSDAVLAPAAATTLVTSGYSARSTTLINSLFGARGLVLTANDGASIGAAVPGRPTIARFTPTAANSVNLLPSGFSAAVMGGTSPGALFGQGSDYVLVGSAAGGTLVTTGNATAIAGQGATNLFGGAGSTNLIGGDANDVFVAGTGATQVYTGQGANIVGLSSGAGTVVSEGTGDIVIGSSGTSLIGVATSATVVNGSGAMTFLGGAGNSLVNGGSGRLTAFGGAGGGVFAGGTAGGNVLVAGQGATTLIGGGAGDVLYATGSVGTVLAAAATGNATLVGGGSTGPNTFFAGGGTNLIGGGSGNETFVAGRGQATITGGAGADVFIFANGRAGGPVTLGDFNQAAGDRIALQGYAGGSGTALAGAQVSAGATVLSLSDGTRITVQNVTNLGASAFV